MQPEYHSSPLPYGGILRKGNTNMISYTVRNALEYRQLINRNHIIHTFVAMEAKSDRHTGETVTGYGWNPAFGEIFMPVYTQSFMTDYVERGRLNPNITNRITRVASFMGTLSYTYSGKYVFNASLRSDGSNKFGSDPRYRWLPTWMMSGMWNITEENFMKNNFFWLDNLSLRGSYGLQGNMHDQLTPNLIARFGGRDSRSGLEYFTIHRLPNPELRWEKTSSWNVGLDFSIFNRLSGGVDLYRKYTQDLIMDKYVPTNNGRSQLFFNAGAMTNYGIEGTLNYEIIDNPIWRLRLGATFGRNVNEITLANDDAFTNVELHGQLLSGTLAVRGAPMGAMYSYQFAGLSAENGHPMFYDEDGRVVHMGDPTLMRLIYSGSIFPKLYGGFDINASYRRRITVSLGFTYNVGNVKRLPSVYEGGGSRVFDQYRNVSIQHINRWRNPGDERHTNIPALVDRDIIQEIRGNPELNTMRRERSNFSDPPYFYDLSDLRVARGDFLKLRSVRIGYVLPRHVQERIGASNIRINLQILNLFTIADKRWEGVDPESANARIPNLPTYTLGVSLNF